MADAIRVLVIDDSARFREHLTTLLTAIEGVEVVGTGTNGFEALTHTERLDPHVVIIDIQMPALDGLEATRRLRRAGASAKIMVMTCHEDDDYRVAAHAAGADAFAIKSRITLGLARTLQVLTGRVGPEERALAEPGREPEVLEL